MAPSPGRRPLGRVHPRHRAGVPQADDRADRDGDEAHLAGARGGRAVLPRARHGDLGRGAAGRGGDGQRHRLSGRRAGRRALGCAWSRATRSRCATRTCRPPLSGLPVGDRSEWAAFRDEYHRVHAGLLAEHNEFRASVGRRAVPAGRVQHRLTVAEPLRVPRAPPTTVAPRPLGPTWHRLESSVRGGEAAFDVAERLPGDGKVVYLSLGSLGCMDVGLMQRLIDALGDHRPPGHRVDGPAQGRDAPR